MFLVKPPPPTVTAMHQDPLEIHWTSTCNQLQGTCDVRHRTEAEQVWPEVSLVYFFFFYYFPFLPLSIVHVKSADELMSHKLFTVDTVGERIP